MKQIVKTFGIAILALLSSCAATIDHVANQTTLLVDHTAEKLTTLKSEAVVEVTQAVQDSLDKGMEKLGATLDATIQGFFNSDVVAFVVVSIVGLLALVVLVALYLLIGFVRTWWKSKRQLGC